MEITRYKDQYVVRFYYKGKHPSITKREWKVNLIKKSELKNIALQAILDKQREIDEELSHKAKNTISVLVDKYLQNDSLSNKASTNRYKSRTIRKYLVSFFGEDNIPRDVINTKSITDFRISISNANLCSASENHIETMTKQFIDFLIAQEELQADMGFRCKALLVPFKKSETPDEDDNVEENVWSKEEFDRFLATFSDDDPYRYFFYFSFYFATRIGETLGVKFSDIDFLNNTLTIKRQRSKEEGITTTKTKASRATIRLPKDVVNTAICYKTLIEASDDDYMFFPTTPLSRTTAKRVFDRHKKKAGVKDITIHGLRHSMATYMLINKFHYLYVSKYLRHSSPQVTLRTYAHWIDNFENDDMIDKIM